MQRCDRCGLLAHLIAVAGRRHPEDADCCRKLFGAIESLGGLDASLLALLFGEDGLSRGVGLLDSALRMDAAERIRSLAADGAEFAWSLTVEGFGLLARRGVEFLGHGRPRGLNGKAGIDAL
jgi:hypothetical protein